MAKLAKIQTTINIRQRLIESIMDSKEEEEEENRKEFIEKSKEVEKDEVGQMSSSIFC